MKGSRRRKLYHDRGIFTAQPEAIEKKLRSRGGFEAGSPLSHMNRHNNKHAGKTKTETKPKQEKPMKTKQSVINSNIRSTVIAAFGLLSTLVPVIQTAHAQDLRPFRFDLVPASDAIANCTSMPNPAATVAVFPREDSRGVDTLDLHAEGLRPNTTFAVFLTELPVPPFGAVQYIGDFTTNAAGRGHVRVDAIIDEAFAFNNITGSVRT